MPKIEFSPLLWVEKRRISDQTVGLPRSRALTKNESTTLNGVNICFSEKLLSTNKTWYIFSRGETQVAICKWLVLCQCFKMMRRNLQDDLWQDIYALGSCQKGRSHLPRQ